ncbi:MAG TPA: hypothetical protein VHE33_05185, partial [Acidobacteriaceae bacterium]|nr:hypothetical protein [Acidobacteriaceae bacterium]
EQSGLYKWSSLRSDYLAQANNQLAAQYGEGYAPGWYWDPWMTGYTFLGPSPFYSPFGWGFYPFGYAGGYWGGYYPHVVHVYPPAPVHHRGFPGYRGPAFQSGRAGGFRGGAFGGGGHLGGFHGGASSGGFHGGGRGH